MGDRGAVGDRGGGSAPAQRRNLSPAHGSNPNAYKDIMAEQVGTASGEPAAGDGLAVPTTVGDRGSGSAPAQRRNISPAYGSSPNT